MSSYRELIYLCMDRLKLSSDDSYFNEEHIRFMLDKYRALIIKRIVEAEEEEDDEVSEENFQTICLDLEKTLSVEGMPCEGVYLRSKTKVPSISSESTARIYTGDFMQCEITFVPYRRIRYVGRNRWLKNIIYAAIGPDNYLYLTSSNPQFLYLSKITVSAIFEDAWEAAELLCCDCDGDSNCDPYDSTFPLQDAYIPQLTGYVVKDIGVSMGMPEDMFNDAMDIATGRASGLMAESKPETTKKSSGTSEEDDEEEQ